MNVFSRSWEIAKVSFGVIKKDKELLVYPILSGIFSIAFFIAMLFPTIIVDYLGQNGNSHTWQILDYVLIFVVYLGLAFIATFFNVCVVYTAKTRFEGGNATMGSSIKFAFSKFGRIFAWAVVSAIVGVILAILQGLVNKSKSAGGRVAGNIGVKVGQAAWSITTLFVIPVIVYHDVGPGEAMKQSWATLKKTWGESIVRHFGMGLIQFLFILLGIGIAIGLSYLFIVMNINVGIIIVIIAVVVYILILALVFSVATQIYNTALFEYAEKGKVPMTYTKELMNGAFS